nr:hypothetical protein [Actinomyces sp. oral taxon 175]
MSISASHSGGARNEGETTALTRTRLSASTSPSRTRISGRLVSKEESSHA